uniref:Probable transcriptional regulatory protein ACHINZ_3470 n=1 Tax=Candidatus Aschnera chinzeii TaxID=1485666 RepID=A0AAT9G4N6_9ENTR|nr:MAG: YebC/PmpR family DNA-binding transcriptional regulator [Candidatus Aschnera chinzeii]
MAGHSKWANTKHRKAIKDNKKGKIFTKIIREVMISARLGGANITSNPKLRATIDKALSNNMTRDAVNRAISRATGRDAYNNMDKSNTYEGYGPGGSAIIVKCLSNNYNRTVSYIRHIFIKYGGNLATNGAVSYLFSEYGMIRYNPKNNKNNLIECVLNLGIQDLECLSDGKIDVYTSLRNFNDIKSTIKNNGFLEEFSKTIMLPINKIKIKPECLSSFGLLIKELKSFIDVYDVYHNVDH